MEQDIGVTPSGSGCEASPSAADASSQSRIPNARIADILDSAADLIEPKGAWAGGKRRVWPRPAGTPTCVGYAIEQCAGAHFSDALTALYRVIPARHIGDLVNWNDARERTQAEVVAKLREAAAKARGEPA